MFQKSLKYTRKFAPKSTFIIDTDLLLRILFVIETLQFPSIFGVLYLLCFFSFLHITSYPTPPEILMLLDSFAGVTSYFPKIPLLLLSNGLKPFKIGEILLLFVFQLLGILLYTLSRPLKPCFWKFQALPMTHNFKFQRVAFLSLLLILQPESTLKRFPHCYS